jgi:hypothetical protein
MDRAKPDGDRALPEVEHAAAVDRWLIHATDHVTQAELVERCGVAFAAIWGHALSALGAVTLLAIAERVLASASAHHGFLSAIPLHPNGDVRWRSILQARMAAVPRPALIAGVRAGMIELLTVLGRLTAEILSDQLHAALRDAARGPPGSERARGPAHTLDAGEGSP